MCVEVVKGIKREDQVEPAAGILATHTHTHTHTRARARWQTNLNTVEPEVQAPQLIDAVGNTRREIARSVEGQPIGLPGWRR